MLTLSLPQRSQWIFVNFTSIFQQRLFPPDVPAPLSPGPVPYPTLYSGQGKDQAPPQGAIQILLYNMSSMLASVAAGYDVRLSNVSPIHPKLNPNK